MQGFLRRGLFALPAAGTNTLDEWPRFSGPFLYTRVPIVFPNLCDILHRSPSSAD
jgi:hypothetical protein